MSASSATTDAVVVIARDAPLIESVSSVASAYGMPVRHVASADLWMDTVGTRNGMAEAGPSPWDGCVVLDVEDDLGRAVPQLERIHLLRHGLPVIVVANQATVRDTVAAMRRGALTVLQRPLDRGELSQAVEEALQKSAELRPRMERGAAARARFALLNDGERAVLSSLLDGKVNKEIAQEMRLGLRTVELRRSKIMKKMHARTLAELVLMICEARAFTQSDRLI